MELQALSLAEMRAQTQQHPYGDLVVGVFAFVAVVISSIGILSIMLVSVVERTREMGLRRALGASRLQIVGQVLNGPWFLSTGVSRGYRRGVFSSEYVSQRLFAQMYLRESLIWASESHRSSDHHCAGSCHGTAFRALSGYQAARITPVDALRINSFRLEEEDG